MYDDGENASERLYRAAFSKQPDIVRCYNKHYKSKKQSYITERFYIEPI